MMSEMQIAELLVRKLMPKFEQRLAVVGGGHDIFEKFTMTVEQDGKEMKATVTVDLETPFSPRAIVVGKRV